MKTFLKEHQRTISLVGISIVLATFILREVVRDYFKDLADSINQAQNAYAILGQINVANGRLREIRHQIDFWGTAATMKEALKDGRSFDDIKTTTETTLEDDIIVIADLEGAHSNLQHLLRALPASDFPPTLKDQESSLSNLKTERSELSSAVGACDNVHQPSGTCSQKFLDDMDKKSDELDVKLLWMGIELTRMSRPVIEHAEHELSRKESAYGWTTFLSAVLFAAGWLLTLLAAIYDLPALAPKES